MCRVCVHVSMCIYACVHHDTYVHACVHVYIQVCMCVMHMCTECVHMCIQTVDNCTLRWLIDAGNGIGDEGATALAAALRHNASVTTLDIGGVYGRICDAYALRIVLL